MKILYAIILGFLPGVIWLLYFYFKDKRPEPKRFVVLAFFFGFLIIIPAALIEIGIEKLFPILEKEALIFVIINSFFVVAFIEEILKFLSFFTAIFKRIEFDEHIDGIVYGVAIGFGFASAENILAILKIGEHIIVPRSLSATLLHGLATGIVGFYFGIYKFKRRKINILLKGLFLAVLFHGIYNLIISYITANFLWVLILFMLFIYFFLFIRIIKAKKLDRKNEYAG